MRRIMESLADRVLAVVVPRDRAAAACIPHSYNICGPVCGLCGPDKCMYTCRLLENCSEKCTKPVGCCFDT